jgi:serine/threonine protein phosphatase PrpC
MRTLNVLSAAGGTDAGLQREVNEDRYHVDEARGVFVVIDGIGGQAAGGKAADIALSMLRERLERETGPVPDRVREAIAIANNEIYRLSSMRPEWDGMACVLTALVLKDGVATIGHVGDTRLYKIRGGRIEKVTRDHSPIGEREDAKELSEFDAMHHPRRNEVYRDVGSEPHAPGDAEFIEVQQIPFETDAALLLCSDGLSDLADSSSILRTVTQLAGHPKDVVRALLELAIAAGGTDNVTAVYVEGERFASSLEQVHAHQAEGVRDTPRSETVPIRTYVVRGAILALLFAIGGLGLYRSGVLPSVDPRTFDPLTIDQPIFRQQTQTVQPTESISAALARAEPGSEIVVEPGEYRERITLRDDVRLVSRVPRGATIRLPATASDAQPEPAVIASRLARSEFAGFKIVGDAKTPLGVGILVADSNVSIFDVEVSGATTAAISFAGAMTARLVGSEIHDNPGTALAVGAGAAPVITQNVFRRNGMSQRTSGTFTIEHGAAPLFQRNVFVGVGPEVFTAFDQLGRAKLKSENWFLRR